MAQGAVVSIPVNGIGFAAPAALAAEELREILEYERLVKFKDAVLAGTHPRVKIHSHPIGKQVNSNREVSSPSHPIPRSDAIVQPLHSTPSTNNDGLLQPIYDQTPNKHPASASAGVQLSMFRSEINPILLEKSDDLIKAEIQLQRQRLERGLREQIEQQRITTKALLQTSESLPNFDISEVLSTALALVHPSTKTDVEPSVGARSSASDSFDENTFYSSQHDTPEASSSSQGQKAPNEVLSRATNTQEVQPEFSNSKNIVGGGDVMMTGGGVSQFNSNTLVQARSQTQHVPTHNQRPNVEQVSDSSDSSNLRGGIDFGGMSSAKRPFQAGSRPNNPASTDYGTATSAGAPAADIESIVQRTNQELYRQAFENARASPVIRAHNLSPLAPQPARVSPLATARDPPVLRESHLVDEAAPAQVAALRNMAAGISSTDSSPKGGKKEKKKDKKKKRKAKDNAANSPDSPYIKPEPRSPSPFAVAPLPRPQKRQRQGGQFAAELNYDEPRSGHDEELHERAPQRYQEVPTQYVRYDDRYEPEWPRAQPLLRRIEREDDDYRRVSASQYARQPQSPVVHALSHQTNDRGPIRAMSQAVVDRRIIEEPRYFREPIPRAMVRPDADRERSRSPIMRERRSPVLMAPPRKPIRIIVDEHGNEYIDPGPGQPMRQSMAPPTRYREPEILYERAPMRAVSARAPVEVYDAEGQVQRRPSPPVPRRVITQPEYAMPVASEHRSYRQREYSTRPTMALEDEFVQVRAPERRYATQYDDPYREYSRAQSTRPEPIRYEIPREYVGRLQSVRPEAPPREYASSVHPEVRSGLMPQAQREYSVRPMESVHRRQPVAAHDGDRYHEEPPPLRRQAEVAFIERPRGRESSVMVYADDVRREVYR